MIVFRNNFFVDNIFVFLNTFMIEDSSRYANGKVNSSRLIIDDDKALVVMQIID